MGGLEAERAQIAHDIHDALLPLVFAASAGIDRLIDDASGSGDEALGREQRLERLRQIASWLQEAMATGREVVTRTYPAELADQSWDQAAAETLRRQSATATLRWRVEPAAREVTAEVALAAYRIVIEAVRNATRHGDAQSVTIETSRRDRHRQVCVEDDGQGFDPDEIPSDRYGIRSMRSRAMLAGGHLELHSRPGGPTRVCFLWPETAEQIAQ